MKNIGKFNKVYLNIILEQANISQNVKLINIEDTSSNESIANEIKDFLNQIKDQYGLNIETAYKAIDAYIANDSTGLLEAYADDEDSAFIFCYEKNAPYVIFVICDALVNGDETSIKPSRAGYAVNLTTRKTSDIRVENLAAWNDIENIIIKKLSI